MISKIGLITAGTPNQSLADHVEIECIKNQNKISSTEIFSIIGLSKEEDYSNGVPEIDETESIIDQLFHELEKRNNYCNNNYPFSIENKGYTLHFEESKNNIISNLYKFLLFATRLNMKDYRTQNGIDGTKVFEEIAELALKKYLGERTESFLMGTANASGNFEAKANKLINLLGEGGEFAAHQLSTPNIHRDDSLDIAAWKAYKDSCPGKLIFFGQCKTGTNWQQELTRLNPDSFCKKWFSKSPAVTPIRTFFITEGIERTRWYEFTADSGILFDRFRIMDYMPEINEVLHEKISSWINGVLKADLL